MIPKRLFWFAAGTAAGAAITLRAQREIEDPAERMKPERVAGAAVSLVRNASDGLKDVVEGRR